MTIPSPARARGALPVAVLGGGITGLSAAWHLRRAGLPVVLFEAAARAGGAIGTEKRDGWLREAGPNSLLEGSKAVEELVEQVGIGKRRLYAAPEARNRYIVRRGRLVAMPASPAAFIATRLFSWKAKLRVLGEPFCGPCPPGRDETVSEFVLRRLGREFLDYAVDPLVGGIYAGDPARLSVRHAFPRLCALERNHGSLIRGAIRSRNATGGPRGRTFSFPDGLAELPQALAHSLGHSVRRRCLVRAVRRVAPDWEVSWESGGEMAAERFSAAVCALPSDALHALRFEGVAASEGLRALAPMEQPPVVSIFTGFRRGDVTHPLDGFGFLVPAAERRRILGTLFSSTLFPARAPEGCVALTSFVGGARQPELAGLGDEELLLVVRAELESLLGAGAAPEWAELRRWPRAIPQYTLGFGDREKAYAAMEADAPGLFIGGNCRDGISLSQCIESGKRLAAAVSSARS